MTRGERRRDITEVEEARHGDSARPGEERVKNGRSNRRAVRSRRAGAFGVRPGGLSLVEAVISSLIVATMLVAGLSALGSSTRAARIHCDKCIGANLARRLMAEVLQSRYREPLQKAEFGPEPPETATSRAAWDDVDDYHRWSASGPQAKDGTPLAHADGWRREVTVEYVLADDPTRTCGSDQGLKRITVTATSPAGKTSTLVALRSEASIYDQEPQTETTYVSAVGVELQIGTSEATRVSSGTSILNPVEACP